MPISDIPELNKLVAQSTGSKNTNVNVGAATNRVNPFRNLPVTLTPPVDTPGSALPVGSHQASNPDRPLAGQNAAMEWDQGYYNADDLAAWYGGNMGNISGDIVISEPDLINFLAPPAEDQPGWAPPRPNRNNGGGATAPVQQEVQWDTTYTNPYAPDWWEGKTPTSGMNASTGYAAIVNNLIPWMSPEDQRSTARFLARQYPDVFGAYAEVDNMNMPIPNDITPQMRNWFQSSQRGREIANYLDRMANSVSAYNPEDFGPGFAFFQNMSNELSDFGGTASFGSPIPPGNPGSYGDSTMGAVEGLPGGVTEPGVVTRYDIPPAQPAAGSGLIPNEPTYDLGSIYQSGQPQTVQTGGAGMTRLQQDELRTALDPLLAEVKGETLAPYAAVAQALATPTFTAGSVSPVHQLPNGQWVYGRPNTQVGGF